MPDGEVRLVDDPECITVTDMSTNDRRKHRRIASSWLNQKAVDSYTPVLDREATELIKALHYASDGGSAPVNPQVNNSSHEGQTWY